MRIALIGQQKDLLLELARALDARGQETRVWDELNLTELLSWQPQQILLRGGAQFLLPHRISRLRGRTGAQISALVSVGDPGRGRWARVRGFAPRGLLFRAICRTADRIFFESERAWVGYQELYLGNSTRFFFLPLGSSSQARSAAQSSGAEKVLLHLSDRNRTSGIHHSLSALQAALDRLGKTAVKLWVVGVSEHELEKAIQRHERGHLRAQVRALGSPTPEELTDWLAQADGVLAPFEKGISAREPDLLIALAQGRAIVGMRGPETDPSPEWESCMELVAAGDGERFDRSVLGILTEPKRAAQLAELARSFYRDYFSWPAAASRLLDAFAVSQTPDGHSSVVTPIKGR
jgi:glycosyltransferase involved in cell wall biosynthesis